MYHNDHVPPHFHVRHSCKKAIIGINPVALIGGYIPARAVGLAIEWALNHQEELLENWERARNNQPLAKIAPLE
jgi:hypothetical protein